MLCQKRQRDRGREGPPIRHIIAIRGSPRAVTTCRKRRRRSDPVHQSGPHQGHPIRRILHAALLLAGLPARRDFRLLAHLQGAEGTRCSDGATPCRRPVLLLHAGRDSRRAARLRAVLHRRRDRHPERLHRFLGRGLRLVEAAAPVGRRHELPRRAAGRHRRDGVGVVARQAELHPRGRLRVGRRADGNAAWSAGELRQWRAVGQGHHCAVGHSLPRRGRPSAPSEPALSGRARRAGDADHHAAAVLEDPRALSPGPARRGVHAGHGHRAFR